MHLIDDASIYVPERPYWKLCKLLIVIIDVKKIGSLDNMYLSLSVCCRKSVGALGMSNNHGSRVVGN